MKKSKYIIFAILTLSLMVGKVYAGASLSTSTSSITSGGSFTVNVNLSGVASWNVRVSASGPVSGCTITDANATDNGMNTNKTLSASCTATGTGTITLTMTGDVTDENFNNSSISGSRSVTVTAPQSSGGGSSSGGSSSGGSSSGGSSSGGSSSSGSSSSSKSNNNNINGISGCSGSGTSYTCPETADGSITFNVSLADSTASVSSGRTCTLNYGANTCQLVVRAQNGATKTYYISVPRTDTRSNDNKLASLEVEGQTIEFDSETTDYNLTVSSLVETVNIIATPNEEHATIDGAGEHTLEIGSNYINITVSAENGETKTYTIVVTRSEKANIPTTSLNKLEISLTNEEGSFNALNVATGKKIFSIGVDSSVTSLYLDTATSSKTSEITVEGNEKLKEGINKITITVKDEDCDDQTYTIYVYKSPIAAEVVTSLTELESIDSDIVYNSNKGDEAILPSEVIKLLKDSNNKLIYNIVNDEGGLLYSFEINKDSDINDTMTLEFVKTSSDPLTYSSNIPKGIKISAYIEELYTDGTSLKLYTYDQKNNKYILISDDVKVEDGFVTFTSDGSSNYILSPDELKVKTSLKEWLIRIVCTLVGAAIATAINFVIRKIIAKKHPELLASKKDEENKEEPKEDYKPIVEEEIKEETPTFKMEDNVMAEPIKPLTYEDIHEKINPSKVEETDYSDDMMFPNIEAEKDSFVEKEEPKFEIKAEEEKSVPKEPRRNIFGEIIDDEAEEKAKKTVVPKSLSSSQEEIKPFAGEDIEPVGSYNSLGGIEVDDSEDVSVSYNPNEDEDISISYNPDEDEDISISYNPNEDDEEIKTITKEQPIEKKKKKSIFEDDEDDDDIVKFPKF